MLKKSTLLLSLLLVSPILPQQLQTKVETEPSELQKWGNFSLDSLKQLAPLALSATIGAITGTLCGHITSNCTHIPIKILVTKIPEMKDMEEFDPTNPAIFGTALLATGFIIFTNLIERSIRDSIIAEVQKGYDKNNIKYNKNLIYTTACIASWFAYYRC